MVHLNISHLRAILRILKINKLTMASGLVDHMVTIMYFIVQSHQPSRMSVSKHGSYK